ELPRAYALTAMLGDIAQIGGAPAAGFLAALVNPAAGLVAAGAFTSFGMVLVLRTVREHDAPDHQQDEKQDEPDTQDSARRGTAKTRSRSAISFPGLRTLTIGGVGAGLGLGAIDIAVTALATVRGDLWAIGLMLGTLGVGGMIGSVVSPRLAQRLSPARRYVTGLGVLVLSTVLMVLTPPGAVVGALLLVAGFAWGVTNVVLYELLDLVVPSTHSTEAWAWLSTAESLGAAGGAAVAGLIAAHSMPLTFAVVPAAVGIGLLTGLLGRRTLTAVKPLPEPELDTASI
ncbi:MFS transporter, partial [Streptomyces sp900116325]|uniref:MFS transporter n=1 Tax=Streptomyces sp. 900116325 TaxID=3154295 RepID=UPI0033E9507D